MICLIYDQICTPGHRPAKDRMHVRKEMAPAGNECHDGCCLMDFTFDLYVFHFLEWSWATYLKLSRVPE